MCGLCVCVFMVTVSLGEGRVTWPNVVGRHSVVILMLFCQPIMSCHVSGLLTLSANSDGPCSMACIVCVYVCGLYVCVCGLCLSVHVVCVSMCLSLCVVCILPVRLS